MKRREFVGIVMGAVALPEVALSQSSRPRSPRWPRVQMAVAGLNNIAMRLTEGATSRSSSTHLLPMVASKLVKPVMFLPGREKLSTKRVPIGSETATNRIGKLRVTCRTAFVAGVV